MEDNENFEDEPRKATDGFSESAKSTANEFKEGWNQTANSTDNKKILAGLLAIFIGYLGGSQIYTGL